MSILDFSVIIPAYNVQGFLRQAVMSVASEPRTEVIVVDDRSTDGTAQLADELESIFESVRVVRPDTNDGLGMARNLGLSVARGDYVVFLDGDDYLAPGSLARLRIAIGSNPSIVMYGYRRLMPNGDAVEGVQRAPLQIEGAFTATEQPQILDVLNVAWNKAYRREFLESLDLEFPRGYYEDIPWSYPILAVADSIIAIDEPLYVYRQRWSGSILRSTDARHLEMVDQFERLMETMGRLGASDQMHAEVYTRAFHNLITLATTKRGRLPAALRSEFYARARRAVRAHRPPNYELPKQGIKWKLMRAMWSWPYVLFAGTFRATEIAKRVVRKSKQTVLAALRLTRSAYHARWVYSWHRRFSRVEPNTVVLENLWGLSPRLNCRAIDTELRSTHPELRLVWSVRRDELANVPAGFETVVKGTHQYFRMLATGKYFFLDTNLPSWWRKRTEQTFTQLHHGTPLKLMGVEERGQSREWKNGLLARSQYWDFSVVSSSYCAEVWQHSYPVRCETLEYGYPRNDALVRSDPTTSEEARSRLELPADGNVFLYMPTFRERNQDRVSATDLNTVAAALDPGVVLLVRGHYLAGRNAGAELHPAVKDVTNYDSVEDLYLASDVLITDYSSAMFDYANLRRPIVIFAHDWENYRHQRGTYFDITIDSPGAVVSSAGQLAAVLATREYDSEENRTRLERFAKTFCTFESGRASADVVARVIDGRVKPDLVRPATPPLTTWHMERIG